jgi:hypothetical protein
MRVMMRVADPQCGNVVTVPRRPLRFATLTRRAKLSPRASHLSRTRNRRSPLTSHSHVPGGETQTGGTVAYTSGTTSVPECAGGDCMIAWLAAARARPRPGTCESLSRALLESRAHRRVSQVRRGGFRASGFKGRGSPSRRPCRALLPKFAVQSPKVRRP